MCSLQLVNQTTRGVLFPAILEILPIHVFKLHHLFHNDTIEGVLFRITFQMYSFHTQRKGRKISSTFFFFLDCPATSEGLIWAIEISGYNLRNVWKIKKRANKKLKICLLHPETSGAEPVGHVLPLIALPAHG